MSGNQQVKGEAPKYRLTEAAYIDDVFYEPEAIITFSGIPGHHMEPLNAAASAMVEKHPTTYVDPILAMTNVTARA